MRPIDADKLKELRHQYIQGRIKFDGSEYDLIDKCPTIDAVEVVRCKDCFCFEDGMVGWCNHWQTGTDGTGYCSYGERRSHHDSLCDQTEEDA